MYKISQRTVRKFKEGDKQAFEEIFYGYKNEVYYFAYYYVQDYDDANDCVQEVFIKLVNTIQQFDEKSAKFESWFYILAKTVILNFIRTKVRYDQRFTCDEAAVLDYAEEDFTELKHALYDLEKLMGKNMYVVYILRIGYKLSFEQISQHTQINRETARRLYNKSLEIVKEYLGEDDYEIQRKETYQTN